MGMAYSKNGEKSNAYRKLVRKPGETTRNTKT
jgi:hypothetical protein